MFRQSLKFWINFPLLVACSSLVQEVGMHSIGRRSVRLIGVAGGSKELECDMRHTEDDELAERIISWKKQGVEVPIYLQFTGYTPHIDKKFENRLRIVEGATIRLNQLEPADTGWYECTVNIIDGDESINGTWIHLTVHTPPVLGKVSQSFLIRKVGDNVDLFCNANGTPSPELSWLKDSKLVTPEKGRVIISKNMLKIRRMVREDGGKYMCIFKNPVGQVHHIIKLVIEGSAYIMLPPKNTTAKEGTHVTLNCNSEGYPSNISTYWFKNGVDVRQIRLLHDRSQVYDDGNFIIRSVMKEDAGWYSCRPTNGLGTAPEGSAYLNVTYLPRVLPMAKKIYLSRGIEGYIKCPVDANPKRTSTTWTKDEKVLKFSLHDRVWQDDHGSIRISKVELEDRGRYSCRPVSVAGEGGMGPVVQVEVKDPPFFSVRPKTYYQRQPTNSVVMPCSAEGDPAPTVSWRRANGTLLSSQASNKDGNLTIKSIQKEDHGRYECIAQNKVATVITSTMLYVELTTPHASYNVTVVTDSISAKVSWEPAYDGGYKLHYIVWFRVTDQTNWHTVRVIPDDVTSVTIYNLLPSSRYEFCVLSRNTLGSGLFSPTVAAYTKPKDYTPQAPKTGYRKGDSESPDSFSTKGPVSMEGIPDPPRNVVVTSIDDDLLISWQPPRHHSHLQYYRVDYRTVGQWVALVERVNSSKNEYLWRTASWGATYHFKVIAVTYEGKNSEDSVPISYKRKNPLMEGVIVTGAMVGGVVGGVIFLMVAGCLSVSAVKFFKKRRQREKAMRYGNVKYFGPKQVDSSKSSRGIVRPGDFRMSDCELAEAVL